MKNKFTRRGFLAAGVTGILLAKSPKVFSNMNNKSREMLLYVGTYTAKESEGIYVYKFDAETGSLSKLHVVKPVEQPSFLAIDKNRKFLYAVNETEDYEGKKSGAVSAFAIDRETGDLTFLNKTASLGGAPCHVSVSENEKFAFVANYSGGNVSVFPIEENGALGASVDLEQHDAGSGANKKRQDAPHAHSLNLDEKNKFALVCDLGADKIFIYAFDKKTGKLTPNPEQNFYRTKPGAGPRHLAFYKNGKFAFLINEIDLTISVLRYDHEKGTLAEIQTVSALPENASRAGASGADIHISPDGNFLYGSNRGNNTSGIVVFKIDEKNGTLEYVEHASTGGKNPRNFAIAPNGKFLLAANQSSDSVVVFAIDKETGKLTPTANKATISMPVCLKLIQAFS